MVHKINFEDVKDLIVEQELAGAYGKGENKSLKVVFSPLNNKVYYVVYDHKKLLGKCDTLFGAVALYNTV